MSKIHVAFAAHSMMGHLMPLIPYMEKLLIRGHSVTCFHDIHPKYRKKLLSLGLDAVLSVTCELQDQKIAIVGGGPMYQCILDHYNDPKSIHKCPDVIIYDFFACSAADAADHFGVPAICIFPNAAVTINPSLVMPEDAGIINHVWCLFMDMFEAAGARVALLLRNRNRRKRSLPSLVEQDIWPCRTMKRLTIGCTGLGLEFAHKYMSPLFVMVGPSLPSVQQPLSEYPDLEKWINAQVKPIVYIAFGTMFSYTERTVIILQQQLIESDVSVLWVLPENEQRWLKSIEEHWRIEKFAPQITLLASGKIAAFVSHCGSNSLYESLLNTVPIVACPGFADQPGNAVRLQIAGVGCIAKGGVSGVRQALKKVVTNDSQYQMYKSNAEKLCKILDTHGGVDRAAKLIEDVAKFGYSHMTSKNNTRNSWFRIFVSVLFVVTMIILLTRSD